MHNYTTKLLSMAECAESHGKTVVEGTTEASESSFDSCGAASKKDCASDPDKQDDPDKTADKNKTGEQAADSLSVTTSKLVDLEFDVDSHPHSLSSIQQAPEPEFLQPLSQDFECPLCLLWLKEPTLTSCCGHHFCRGCIEHVVERDHVCPLCKEKGFETFLNKDIQRKLNTQKVYCRQKSRGCEWVGELGKLECHLDVAEGDCGFVMVECEFGPVGCIAKFPRKDLQRHREESLHKHLSLVSVTSLKTSQEQQSQQQEIRDLQQKLGMKDEEISVLQSKVDELERSLSNMQDQLQQAEQTLQQLDKKFIPPPDFVMTDFKQRKKEDSVWYSPPFYSHVGGYKLCLRVHANGYGRGKGSFVSIFIHVVPGENDDNLEWPFRGTIRVVLLNQRKEEDHYSMAIRINDEVPDSAAGRVKGLAIRSPEGWGFFRFVAHRMLHVSVSTYDVEYLKNDCLKFRIRSVKIGDPGPSHEQHRKHL